MRISGFLAAFTLLAAGFHGPVSPPSASPGAAAPHSALSLDEGFRNVPIESRMRLYWRVFGPAWTKPEIDRQLEIIKKSGAGGVTIYFLYPVEVDDPGRGIVNQRFGSPDFLRTFGYAARKAAELGLRLTVNAGTGWPFGGPAVGPEDAALRLRPVRAAAGSSPPAEILNTASGDKVVAAFLGGEDVTEAARAGRLPDPLPHGLTAFLSGPTDQQVKRASYGGEGQVLSHFDRAALERWLAAVVQPLLDAAPGLTSGLGCDSLEVYRSNWAADLPEEFHRRRGYDLIPRLPDLFDDASAARRGLRFDFWRTLAELLEERFIEPLGSWCEKRGLVLEMEAYGTPPNPMTAARSMAIPTGEHYEWRGYCVQRYAASMARMAGRNIVGAEAWTWAGIPNRLGDSLSDLKVVSDMTFLAGANDLTGVDVPYSPAVAGAPGWLPYFGPILGPGNPQWRFFPALSAYLNRCQWLLRQGEPIRKIGLYLPVEDIFSDGSAEQMLLDFALKDRLVTGAPTSEFGLANALRHHSDLLDGLVSAGFEYDGLDFWALQRLGEVKGKRLVVGQAGFEAVVLPNLERISPEALERLAAFCRAGGTIVASRRLPDAAPGLNDESGTQRVRELVDKIFGVSPQPDEWHACGRGKALLVPDERAVGLVLAGTIEPQIRFDGKPLNVGFVHRQAGGRDIYFLANVGTDEARFGIRLPGAPPRLEAWDAKSGSLRRLPTKGGRAEVLLPARNSIFVVAWGRTPGTAPPEPTRQAAPDRMIEIRSAWSLRFDGPDAPSETRLAGLVSWTELPGGRFFSGAAVYSSNFVWKGALPRRAILAFEQIREAAEVRLNGVPLGILYSPPLEIEATAGLQQGLNRLEIIVVNLPLNRFLGLPDQDLGPLRARFGNRFPDPQEKKVAGGPAPSGLIGQVRLLAFDKT